MCLIYNTSNVREESRNITFLRTAIECEQGERVVRRQIIEKGGRSPSYAIL
jgi:hypothetical protein